MEFEKSKKAFDEAKKYIPGGVNSPVRAFGSVDIAPIFIEKAKGSKIYDIDGNEYIDYICSWGPLILGHSNEKLVNGIEDEFKKGTSYGLPTQIETKMAKKIVDAYPSVEKVRMVNSGTEATMSALRLARAYTKKKKIIKFEGCYHGHSDGLLVKSGSGTLTYGIPTSPGVNSTVIEDTIVCEYNNIDSVKKAFQDSDDIAAVIVEPVAGNMGVVEAKKEFLEELRKVTKEYNSLLIFDEVITGFRLSYSGAQGIYDINPDLTCFGKIIGGGLPVGAYGGKAEIMDMIAPLGGVYQAGTLSGNPLAMYMGYNTLEILENNKDIYDDLQEKAKKLEKGLNEHIEKLNIDVTINRVKAMICIFMSQGPVDSYSQVMKSDTDKYAIFFKEMLKQGILLPPAQFEGLFLSTAHTDCDIEKTIDAAGEAFKVAFRK
ncbi:glutamate-1-semialdehyde 2,1-aminomutase [Senegalia massiliensis]|uniref:Glutamate-1-semialdehyde 2,1-aminomutase n=1 Tax=Senegalia massiliensis TaxID=1720316 RepID=A0A845QWU7_9CLOT|nr:glutamate-1-semialdehyde 2,1-aminomutase [Senegalia massiliensis]NBI06464.1 glutamate-1-semialdehyde-2,1-aminomutase [Senegalia massiliensis]